MKRGWGGGWRGRVTKPRGIVLSYSKSCHAGELHRLVLIPRTAARLSPPSFLPSSHITRYCDDTKGTCGVGFPDIALSMTVPSTAGSPSPALGLRRIRPLRGRSYGWEDIVAAKRWTLVTVRMRVQRAIGNRPDCTLGLGVGGHILGREGEAAVPLKCLEGRECARARSSRRR
jgi:hypothetical protein